MNHLFLASTPFNAILSALIAQTLPANNRSTLWLIDQPESISNFTHALLNWKYSPFLEIKIASYKAKNIREKLSRKQSLKKLAQESGRINPDYIYTSNDRRIEFQYLMASSSKKKIIGSYIDDGTYTYTGRKTNFLLDHIIDSAIKKIFYGKFWKQPKDIGASDWIKNVHVAFPEKITHSLKSKQVHQLPEGLDSPAFQSLSEMCLTESKKINQLKKLVILPHESLRNSQCFHSLINETNSSEKTGFKDHPRNTKEPIDIAPSVLRVPSDIPLEVILPCIDSSCTVIGDVSTALLTSKWLRPEIEVVAYIEKKTVLSSLMKELGIKLKYIN